MLGTKKQRRYRISEFQAAQRLEFIHRVTAGKSSIIFGNGYVVMDIDTYRKLIEQRENK